ncbi:MAG TPA: hypothetical protein VF525_01490 [Pyrinomonadaceae bacterium]|jgi:hypothetical protein
MSHAWQLQVGQFLLPKEGAEAAECEDAIGVNLAAARFAVADGATEAFDARSWARHLAEGWVAAEPPALTREAFGAWVAGQGSALHESWQGRTLSWYAEEKARRGSFAAFVGVQFELTNGAPRWTALALGDSCLIQRRGRAVCHALPVADHQRFTSTPLLVPSLGQLHEAALGQTLVERGAFEPTTDVLWLLSDATAEWFLKRAAERDEVLDELDRFAAAERAADLTALFQQERRARRIKDDDVAVVRITLSAV